ncbi:hypothetical protein ACFLZB_04905 [Nanoarchaeota archaeon]
MEEHKFSEIRKVVNELMRVGGEVILKAQIIKLAKAHDFTEEEAKEAIKHFIEEGTLIELDDESVEVPV